MILRLLNRILFVVAVITLGWSAAMAQDSYEDFDVVAVRGIKRIYSLPENKDVTFFWSYKDSDGAIIPVEGNTNILEYAFSEEGDYILSVYATDKESGCFSESIEKKIKVLDAGFEVELGEDRMICPGDTAIIAANVSGKHVDGKYDDLTFEWVGSDQKTQFIKVVESGTYEVKVTDKYGNSVYDAVNIDLYPTPIVDLGEDLIIVKGESVVLYTNDNFAEYEWSTGETIDEIDVNKHGKYWLTATDVNKCTASDTVNIYYEGEATLSGLVVSLPTGFSPNNDGVNDKLLVRGSLSKIKKISFIVYRKDGVKMFETSNVNEGWDGIHHGVKQNVDGYIYFLKVVFVNDEVLTKRGTVSLLK